MRKCDACGRPVAVHYTVECPVCGRIVYGIGRSEACGACAYLR